MDPLKIPASTCGKHEFRWDETSEGIIFWCPQCARAFYLTRRGEGEDAYLTLTPFLVEDPHVEEEFEADGL